MAYDSRNEKNYLICSNQKHRKNSFFWLGKHNITDTLSITDNVGVTKTEGEIPQMVARLLLFGNNGMQFYPIAHKARQTR